MLKPSLSIALSKHLTIHLRENALMTQSVVLLEDAIKVAEDMPRNFKCLLTLMES